MISIWSNTNMKMGKKKQLNPIHYKIKGAAKIDGFAIRNIPQGKKIEEGDLLTKGFYHSGQVEYYYFMKQISNLYLNKYFDINNINIFLILFNCDDSADLYVNNIETIMKIKSNNALIEGQLVKDNEIKKIESLTINNINIDENNNVIFGFRVNWRFGVYFNFKQLRFGKKLDKKRFAAELGECLNNIIDLEKQI